MCDWAAGKPVESGGMVGQDRELALEQAETGGLNHVVEDRPVRPEEVDAALSDLRKLTEGGIVR